jgi:hemerythrin
VSECNLSASRFAFDQVLGVVYPHIDRHRRAHSRLLESVADARRRFDAGDFEGTRRFCADLLGWFRIHAHSEDAELAAFLKGPAA